MCTSRDVQEVPRHEVGALIADDAHRNAGPCIFRRREQVQPTVRDIHVVICSLQRNCVTFHRTSAALRDRDHVGDLAGMITEAELASFEQNVRPFHVHPRSPPTTPTPSDSSKMMHVVRFVVVHGHEQGFVTVETPLTGPQLDAAEEMFDRLVEPVPGDGRTLHGTFRLDVGALQRDATFTSLIDHAFFRAVAQQVLRGEPSLPRADRARWWRLAE